MSTAVLTISHKNYSAWSLKGWLLCKLAGLDFQEKMLSIDDPAVRAEILLLTPSKLIPSLEHEGAKVWDVLSIAEYLAELKPDAGILPLDRKIRAHCRSVSAEAHAGFFNFRSALPMSIKARHKDFKIWSGAKPDIKRILDIWRDCLSTYNGPYLFGKVSMADAIFAPTCSRFLTYSVELDNECKRYCETIMAWPAMIEWISDAKEEPLELEEVDAEF